MYDKFWLLQTIMNVFSKNTKNQVYPLKNDRFLMTNPQPGVKLNGVAF